MWAVVYFPIYTENSVLAISWLLMVHNVDMPLRELTGRCLQSPRHKSHSSPTRTCNKKTVKKCAHKKVRKIICCRSASTFNATATPQRATSISLFSAYVGGWLHVAASVASIVGFFHIFLLLLCRFEILTGIKRWRCRRGSY